MDGTGSQNINFDQLVEDHPEEGVFRVHRDVYLDPVLYELEMVRIFESTWVFIGLSSEAEQPHDYMTRNIGRQPVIIMRDQQGKLGGFLNSCRHKGLKLCPLGSGNRQFHACPYHGWTYDLDGRLRGMRQPAGFESLDKEAHGLLQLPAFERFGLIWVRPTPSEQNIDIDTWLAPMEEQLASLDLARHCVYREWSLHRNMNWRIALEGFLETYHFCSAHKETACSAYLDNQSPFLDKYPHVRNAVPLARITQLEDKDPDSWDYRANFMTQNYLFPCNFVQVMTDHVYIHTIVPTGPDTCVFKCLMLIPEPAETAKAQKHWDANYNVVKTVFDEDFKIGEGIQQGFASGANSNFTFGRYEAGLQLAQTALEDALQGRLSVPYTLDSPPKV